MTVNATPGFARRGLRLYMTGVALTPGYTVPTLIGAMPVRYITDSESEDWRAIADKLNAISRLISECQTAFILLNVDAPRAKAVLDAIEHAASGQAYMFTPQPEWGQGSEEFKTRAPHIAQ